MRNQVAHGGRKTPLKGADAARALGGQADPLFDPFGGVIKGGGEGPPVRLVVGCEGTGSLGERLGCRVSWKTRTY